MNDCLFCKIIKKEIPSTFVYEDENTYAFRDIHPQAKTHILVVTKKHIASVDEITPSDNTLNNIFTAIRNIAAQEKISGSGYRASVNKGSDAGQTVAHLHFHIMGGGKLSGKMA
ncbi:MAG: histidine triad nucleotide-binding protein [Pseudomonadota bacterium]